jgi:magnesium chelatase family protein
MSSLAIVKSRALDGLHAPQVDVEVQLANGLPSFTLVGLADTEVKESRERVRAALQQSGFAFPHNQRITVNLAPAELPKEGGRFDLPIALGILAAAGQLCLKKLASHEFAGELSLAGELRPVRGAVAHALALRQDNSSSAKPGQALHLVLPQASARLAAAVPDLRVLSAVTLCEVVAALQPEDAAQPLRLAKPWPGLTSQSGAQSGPQAGPDLAEVKGLAAAKRALEIAAAGGHSLLLVGPPGSGKSMLAQRLPGLLPPLTLEEALASAALRDLKPDSPQPGRPGESHRTDAGWVASHRPFRSPHHTASAVALVGGGSPPRPGEISLAHGGVLFLDELPEFPRSALEALREPLETGNITLARAARSATFPARFQLIAAMNPCPCGWLGSMASARQCRCSPDSVARYQGKLSGPLLDRIDLQVEVQASAPSALLAAPDGDSSAVVASRVALARQRQMARQGKCNAELSSAEIDVHCRLAPEASSFLQGAALRLGWSGRRLHRTLRVARSVADLAAEDTLQIGHLAEALQLQRALSG